MAQAARRIVLTFNATLVYNSSIETVDYPYFGDFTSPTPDTPMHTERLWVGALNAEEIYPHFNNGKGYWGVLYPTKTIESDVSQFCLIRTLTNSYRPHSDPPAKE